MILILVLGNILVLSPPVSKVILTIAKYATSTQKAVVIVSFSVMLVAFFNWGLGLIFGAILARKIGDYSAENNIKLNYPLVGAAGYVGLMVWHSGISGSAPIKVAEDNHLLNLMSSRQDSYLYEDLPVSLNFDLTVLSNANLITFVVLLVLVPLTFYFLSKNTQGHNNILKNPIKNQYLTSRIKSNGLEGSRLFSIAFGMILLTAFFYQYFDQQPNVFHQMKARYHLDIHHSRSNLSRDFPWIRFGLHRLSVDRHCLPSVILDLTPGFVDSPFVFKP
jgi:short-chain fatty acids transporter